MPNSTWQELVLLQTLVGPVTCVFVLERSGFLDIAQISKFKVAWFNQLQSCKKNREKTG